MTDRDVQAIVNLLDNWKRPPLRWTTLQDLISKTLLNGQTAWSRQSLQASEPVNTAWLRARIRLSCERKRSPAPAAEPTDYEKLAAAYAALEVKFQNLAFRHRQLIYNASMLPGGTRLFLDPLPDNTQTQKDGVGARRSSRK